MVVGLGMWGSTWWRVWICGDRHGGGCGVVDIGVCSGAVEVEAMGHGGCKVCGWSVSVMGGSG